MRGVLIYTATSDSAGSLGGVVAQGASDRLEGLVREGVNRAAWCSADPVCIEARVTLVGDCPIGAVETLKTILHDERFPLIEGRLIGFEKVLQIIRVDAFDQVLVDVREGMR